MKFDRGFKARANRIAVAVRRRMDLTPTDPLDPLAVCSMFDIDVIRLSELPCDASAFLGADAGLFSAMTVPCGIRTGIVHNDRHHPLRQRSNLCHELAHILLGHEHAPALDHAGGRTYDRLIEAEANFLGGCLLITNEAALHIVSSGLMSVARQVYGVSQPMLEYRIRVSGARIRHGRRLGVA